MLPCVPIRRLSRLKIRTISPFLFGDSPALRIWQRKERVVQEETMSVAGILSSAAFGIGAQLFHSRMQQVNKDFQQLGQDLWSGNLTAAQSDFATLRQLQPGTSSTQSTTSIAQDMNQLAADLKAGNTTAAQLDFTKLQQD